MKNEIQLSQSSIRTLGKVIQSGMTKTLSMPVGITKRMMQDVSNTVKAGLLEATGPLGLLAAKGFGATKNATAKILSSKRTQEKETGESTLKNVDISMSENLSMMDKQLNLMSIMKDDVDNIKLTLDKYFAYTKIEDKLNADRQERLNAHLKKTKKDEDRDQRSGFFKRSLERVLGTSIGGSLVKMFSFKKGGIFEKIFSLPFRALKGLKSRGSGLIGKGAGLLGALSIGTDLYEGYKEEGWKGAGKNLIGKGGWKGAQKLGAQGAALGMLFGPLGAVIGGGVGALVGWLGFDKIIKGFEMLRKTMNKLWDWIKERFDWQNIKNTLTTTGFNIYETVVDFGRIVIDTLFPIEKIKNILGEWNIGEKIQGFATSLLQFIMPSKESIQKAMKGFGFIKQLLGKVLGIYEKMFSMPIKAIEKVFQSDVVQQQFNNIKEGISSLFSGIAQGIAELIPDFLVKHFDWAKNLKDKLMQFVTPEDIVKKDEKQIVAYKGTIGTEVTMHNPLQLTAPAKGIVNIKKVAGPTTLKDDALRAAGAQTSTITEKEQLLNTLSLLSKHTEKQTKELESINKLTATREPIVITSPMMNKEIPSNIENVLLLLINKGDI